MILTQRLFGCKAELIKATVAEVKLDQSCLLCISPLDGGAELRGTERFL